MEPIEEKTECRCRYGEPCICGDSCDCEFCTCEPGCQKFMKACHCKKDEVEKSA